ncbi:MFS transporter [Roseinatronobacter monicus]|uniref:Putative MFS family arabinose efflux permease n=1 Tax=Roseinatronobacter monicus TaxID=393481 RepID=A0A543K5V2_9RHOB|nr:MFS transporter [Roseinatronobacter monicus]TQM90442.1 putative MFS family arabinose efflux permease [Roseinatronobacter monicus]
MTAFPKGPQQIWPQFGLLVGAHCLGAMNLLAVLACSPLIAAELQLSATEIGLIASAYALGITLLSIPAGRLSDVIGVRMSLLLAGLVMVAGTVVFALAQGIGQAFAGMFIVGSGYSLVNPAAGRAVMLWYPTGVRATLMGIKQTGVPLGGALGTSAALLAPVASWQGVVMGVGAVTAACGVAFLLLPADNDKNATPRVALSEELAAIRLLFRNPVLGRNNLASGLNNGAQFILWSHLIEFLRLGAGFGLPMANACLSLLHICSIAGRVFWGWATDWFFRADSRLTLMIVTGVSAVSLLAMATIGPSNAVLLAPLVVAVLGLTICSATGVQVALTLQSIDPPRSGGAIGYNMVATNLGGVLAPPLFGMIVETSGGFALAWCLIAAAVIFAFGLLWVDRQNF